MAYTYSSEDIEKIIATYRQLGSAHRAAEVLGMASTTLYGLLKRHNVPRFQGGTKGLRFIKVSDAQILEAYARVGNAVKVGKELGINEKTVLNALRANGVAIDGTARYRKRVRAIPEDSESAIITRYIGGESAADIAQEFGCGVYPIYGVLQRHGITTRHMPYLSDEEKAQAAQLYAEGNTYAQVAALMERSESSIVKAIETHAPDVMRHIGRRGEESFTWKGGRVLHHSGYVHVYVADDDPLISMAQSAKGHYVPEHRLVMARALGRPLAAHETVHHINGIKDDNRLENLQLRQGKHGRGVRLQCLDCGSHNVTAVALGSEAHHAA